MPGPANLYGVNNSPAGYAKVALGGTVNCPAGVETVVFTSVLIFAVTAGYYYATVIGGMWIQTGATAPSSLVISARIGAGADFDGIAFPALILPTAGSVFLPYFLPSPISNVAWFPTGSTISVTVNAGGQAVTCNNTSGYAYIQLLRSSDQ